MTIPVNVTLQQGQSILAVDVYLDTSGGPPGPGGGPSGGGGAGYDYTVGTRIPAWLRIDGQELSNPARALDYMRFGRAGPSIMNVAASPCGWLYRVDGPARLFNDPIRDPAPWYDSSRPESAQFLGVIVNDLKLGSVTRRSPIDLPGRYGGSVLGARQSIGRRIDVAATIVAASVAGADYGVEWLSGLLGDAGCETCGSSTVEFRQACPPEDGSDDQMGYWMAYRAGLISGPDIATQDPYGNLTDVTWSWVSESPYLYKSVLNCLPESVVDPSAYTGCVPFDDWFCGVVNVPQCCTIAPPQKGTWSGIITIRSIGTVGGVTLAAFDACPPDLTQDAPTSQMQVRELTGTLIIDSAQHQVTYISDPDPVTGQQTVRDGTDFILVPPGQGLQWIEVDYCDPAKCICVYPSYPCGQGQHATVQIDVQYRRR